MASNFDLGVRLTLLAGPTLPVPVSESIIDSLLSAEVTHSDEAHSGFQLTFATGRSGPGDLRDYALLSSPNLKPFCRVILVVTIGVEARVLMDGMITHLELQPGSRPGEALFTVTGEDVSVMMDLEEKLTTYPRQSDMAIVYDIIGNFSKYGLTPDVVPPPVNETPDPRDFVPIQRMTDRAYVEMLAARYGYVFYVVPGPTARMNTAYWGPPKRTGAPQKELSANMGPDSNVESISFSYNALAPVAVSGKLPAGESTEDVEVPAGIGGETPLVAETASAQPSVRTVLPDLMDRFTYNKARARAEGIVRASLNNIVTAEGELDAVKYGDVLEARRLVELRGAGYTYDGLYYVKRVTHLVSEGAYTQRFTLARDGVGALS